MAMGAALFLAATMGVLHFREDRAPGREIALKARRLDAVGAMRVALATASEVETHAVIAVTEADSKTYADQARAATAEVERGRAELAALLKTGGTQDEKELLDQFSRAFAELRRIDAELLALAVRNSNLKASGLAFGPATKELRQIDEALSRIVAKNADGPDAKELVPLALGAQIAALRIETLLAPHIAEESSEKMDEVAMGREDRVVRSDLSRLSALARLRGDPDLEAASSSYARFSELRTQILALSRENTNVRSAAISLGEKRKVTLVCRASLDALLQAIQAEPPADYGRFGRPIQLP
jgi:hypothetical protein